MICVRYDSVSKSKTEQITSLVIICCKDNEFN